MNFGVVAALIALALIVAAAYFFVGNPSQKSASESMSLIHNQSFCLEASANSAIDIAISGGIKCFRMDIEQNSSVASFISNKSKLGAQFLGILDYDTVGARPSPNGCVFGCNWSLDDWNESVANAVLNYPAIHQWEIWNEPLVTNFASGYENGNATHYFNMIKSAYGIIKARDPNATVVCFGGPQLFPLKSVAYEYDFYKQVWALGASKYCDAISLHAYTDGIYNLSQEPYANVTMARVFNFTINLYENLTKKPIWITETGIPSGNWPGQNLTERNQALFLGQDLRLLSSYSFVRRIYWFNLVERGSTGDYGIINASTLQGKPAWQAFLNISGQ